MNTENKKDYKYAAFKALKASEPFFVDMTHEAAVEEARNRYGNCDLQVSTWYSAVPDISAPRNYFICFRIVSNNPETAHVSALESIYYIEENYCISAENLEIIYADGGEKGGAIGRKVAGNGTNTGQNNGKTGQENGDHVGKKAGTGPDGEILADIGKKADQQADNNVRLVGRADDQGHNNVGGVDETTDNRPNDAEIGYVAGGDGRRNNWHNPPANNENRVHKGPRDAASAAEIVILIHPMVFGGRLTPALNCRLAHQMVDDGLTNIEIDAYVRDSYIPLPNSMNSATGRFVIPLPLKELLYLDGHHIAELSKQPRTDDSLIQPSEIPEAVEWFAVVLADFEKEQHRQDELRKLVLKNGWQIPSCIRRLTWADLDKNMAFETCRLISGTYSFLGSNEEEIRYHVMRLARRNSITGFKEYQKLKNIVTYGVENPMPVECQHPLMSRFCPAGGCYIAELIEEYEKPLLFE